MGFSVVSLYRRLTSRRNGHTQNESEAYIQQDEREAPCPRCGDTGDLSTISAAIAGEEEGSDDELTVDVPGYACRRCGFEFFNERQSAEMDEKVDALLISV